MYSNIYEPQDKWAKDNGYISKSFKLRKDICDRFNLECMSQKVSMSEVLTKFMVDYIEGRYPH